MNRHLSLRERESAVDAKRARSQGIDVVEARMFPRFLTILTMPIAVCVWLASWLVYFIGEMRKLG